MFGQAKKNSPCILFIDEIDAVGRHRGAGLGGGHDEREQTLNQLLVELDGFEPNEALIVIAATNRPDVLDPALLRPGRFDRQVVVPVPDVRGREQILQVHSKKVPLAKDVSLQVVARGTPGFSGADLENLINEAALMAARQNKDKVGSADLENARDKLMMGVERKSMIMSEDEKKTTAWHEAGHTLVALLLPHSDPLHKVTIIPRGMALGVTQYLPTEDRYTYSRDYFLTRLAILLGGRVAEETCLDQITTGAGNDIERATKLAYNMVCRYGMSKRLGPLNFRKQEDQIFLGREIAQHRDYSEETAKIIDEEVNSLVMGAYETARRLIEKHRDTLKVLAELLLEKETLEGSDVIELTKAAILAEGLPIPEVGESFDAKTRKKPKKARKKAAKAKLQKPEDEPEEEPEEEQEPEDSEDSEDPEEPDEPEDPDSDSEEEEDDPKGKGDNPSPGNGKGGK
jgi:cell division protease FtsH